MRKNHFLLVCLFLCVGLKLLAQNPLTIIAPKYIKNSVAINLPTGPGVNDYHGAKAEYASNAFPDAQGNLKFFIVDDQVYDAEGYQLGDISVFAQWSGKGRSEIAVVKDPGNCERFYIFTTGVYSPDLTKGDEYFALILDFTMTCQINSTRMGELYQPGSWGGSLFGPNFKDANGHWAISKPRSDGSHFVFCTTESTCKIYKLDQTGVTYTGINFNFGSMVSFYDIRCELEVFELPDGGPIKYKVAAPHTRIISNTNCSAVSVMSLDASGNLVSMQQFWYPMVITANGQSPFLHGLEFDPSGRYLFITHTVDPLAGYNTGIDYIDLNAGTPAITPLNVTGNINYQNSQIEYFTLGGVPGLYVANATGFARIVPNANPSLISLVNGVFATGVAANYMQIDTYGPSYPYNNYKTFVLPDQIDGFNYNDFYIQGDDISCCLLNSLFDKNSFTATTNATWTAGNANNPLARAGNNSNTVTIRDELRIPRGKSITISGMILKFAPGAKLIIEEGNDVLDGGRLILDNTTLTVDVGCSSDMMWDGVEVWGRSTLVQGSAYGSSQQGRLIVQNGSIIEHASKGVVLGAFDENNGTYSTTKTGGIITATGSTFRNNQRDVVARSYVAPGGLNNVSVLSDCSFLVTAPLKGGLTPISRVDFYYVKGMNVSGCTFSITEPTFKQTGYGIFSRNTTFNANARCASGTSPCTSYDPNIFENFNFGIYVTNTSATDAFSADRNTYIDNNIGVRAQSSNGSTVTRSNFKVFEKTTQTSGVYFTSSTGFTIQENNFGITNATPLANARTYGVIIGNSTVNANLVYNNYFTKLYIGGQSDGVNGNAVVGNSTGLVWKCNTFASPIAAYDLSVANNGAICYDQGYMYPSDPVEAAKRAANNRFSLTGESTSLTHDFVLGTGAQPINYVYTTPSGMGMIPDSYSTTYMTIQQSVNTSSCPSLLSGGKVVGIAQREVLATELDRVSDLLVTNETDELASEHNQLQRSYDLMSNELLSSALLDAENYSLLEKEVESLELRDNSYYNQVKFELALKNGNVSKATEFLNNTNGLDYAFNKIYMDIQAAENQKEYLTANPDVVAVLQEMAKNESNPSVAGRAAAQLEELFGFETTYAFGRVDVTGQSNLSIGEFSSNTIMVYPNPTQGSVVIENMDINGVVEVLDLTGKVVHTMKTSEQNTVIDLSRLNSGVYIVKVTDAVTTNQVTARIVKK